MDKKSGLRAYPGWMGRSVLLLVSFASLAALACEPRDLKVGEAPGLSLGGTAGRPALVVEHPHRVNSGLWVSDDGEAWVAGFERPVTDVGSGFVGRVAGVELEVEFTNPSELRAVWGCDDGTLHAVGATTAARANGEWAFARPPGEGLFRDVWGTPNCERLVAVGDDGAIAEFVAGDWRRVESPAVEDLNGVWGTAPDNIVAVGNGGTIIRFDGKSWSFEESGTSLDLLGVWGTSESGFYAVGGSTVGGGEAVVQEFDGMSWRTALRSEGFKLWAINGNGVDRVYAAGGQPDPRHEFAVIMEREDSAWAETTMHTTPTLRDVWVLPNSEALAVGEHGIVFNTLSLDDPQH